MLVDGIKLLEGSSISNASIETGTAFPTTANMGELFFKTTDDLLYVYNGTVWTAAGSGGTGAASSLTGTTLASNVVSSSLTSVGTLGSLTVTGNVTASDPTTSGHLATKSYVDTAINGLTWKTAVSAASTANLTLSGTQTVDGVALAAGNRVLVKNQTTATQNGVYVVAAGAWTRSTDMDGAPSVGEVNGAAVYVTDGTTFADTAWTQTATITVVGSQAMTFAQFAATGAAAASTLTGTTLASNVLASSLTSVGTLVSGTKVNSTGTAGASLNVGGSLAVDTNTSNIPLAGTAGALQLGYLNGTVTSTQDAYVAWGGVSAAATLSPGQAGGTLILSARNAGSAGVSIATAGTSRLFVSSTGVTSFKGAYDEQSTAVTATASTTLDLSTANTFTVTLGVSITTLAFSNVPASGRVASVTLVINHSVASTTIAWPASVKWSGGTAPTLTTTAGKTDIVSLMTPDGGTNWYGFVAGLNF